MTKKPALSYQAALDAALKDPAAAIAYLRNHLLERDLDLLTMALEDVRRVHGPETIPLVIEAAVGLFGTPPPQDRDD